MFFKKLLFVFVLLLVLSACGAQGNSVSVPQTTEVVHSGNMWYLPINKAGLPEANIGDIFQKITNWQEQHPDLTIIDVDYLYMQDTYDLDTSNFTYGVSLLTTSQTAVNP